MIAGSALTAGGVSGLMAAWRQDVKDFLSIILDLRRPAAYP